jgi:hypothetical protein
MLKFFIFIKIIQYIFKKINKIIFSFIIFQNYYFSIYSFLTFFQFKNSFLVEFFQNFVNTNLKKYIEINIFQIILFFKDCLIYSSIVCFYLKFFFLLFNSKFMKNSSKIYHYINEIKF